jgi:hypothetical protein
LLNLAIWKKSAFPHNLIWLSEKKFLTLLWEIVPNGNNAILAVHFPNDVWKFAS